jgi:hypothetical protein
MSRAIVQSAPRADADGYLAQVVMLGMQRGSEGRDP